jgi:Mg2+-importing ATPase
MLRAKATVMRCYEHRLADGMAVGIYLPFSPLGAATGMVPLPPSYFAWLVLTLLAHCILTQRVKVWYMRRFNAWLL